MNRPCTSGFAWPRERASGCGIPCPSARRSDDRRLGRAGLARLGGGRADAPGAARGQVHRHHAGGRPPPRVGGAPAKRNSAWLLSPPGCAARAARCLRPSPCPVRDRAAATRSPGRLHANAVVTAGERIGELLRALGHAGRDTAAAPTTSGSLRGWWGRDTSGGIYSYLGDGAFFLGRTRKSKSVNLHKTGKSSRHPKIVSPTAFPPLGSSLESGGANAKRCRG